MRDIQTGAMVLSHNQKKKTQAQMTVSKNSKLNQLSVEKIRDLVSQNMIKKSSSLANFGPLLFNSTHGRIGGQNKNTTESRLTTKKAIEYERQPKSPKKTSCSDLTLSNQNDYGAINFDLQEKRRRIYGMPYYFQSPTVQKLSQQIKYIAVPPSPQYLPSSTIPFMKNYNESISTNASNKQTTQLRVSDFQIGKILGIGKFGHVYMAKHIASGFVCALKQIKKDSLDEVLQTQLIREIKIQMFLNHPNIVKLYTFFKDQDCIYLVLQLCSSGQLYNFLKKHQPIKQDLAKVIIRQICQGLDYIHENHIIHRDLKPENILYHNSMMKICDFGWSIATPLMRETFCGTPLYISPELLRRTCYDNKIDTWSLGILAYQILIGQVPFQIFCQADYVKILKNDVRFPKFLSISQQAKDFIRGCLQKDPYKRLSSSQLLQHPFLKKVQLINFPDIN